MCRFHLISLSALQRTLQQNLKWGTVFLSILPLVQCSSLSLSPSSPLLYSQPVCRKSKKKTNPPLSCEHGPSWQVSWVFCFSPQCGFQGTCWRAAGWREQGGSVWSSEKRRVTAAASQAAFRFCETRCIADHCEHRRRETWSEPGVQKQIRFPA